MQVNGIRTFVGIGFLLISGLGFAVNIIVAVAALKDGIDLNTSNAARYFVAAMILFFYQIITKRPIIIPPK